MQLDLTMAGEVMMPNNQIPDANYFYKPELFEIINNYLYFMPCWSGTIISEFREYTCDSDNKIITRLTNNPVENHIGFTKVNQLGNKLSPTSSIVSSQYKRVKSKFFSLYENSEINVPINVTSKIYNNKELLETWKNKEIVKQREKGFYYQNIQNFDSNKTYQEPTPSIYNNFKNPDENNSFFSYENEINGDFLN
jgi:hypothetical protein